MPGDPQQPWQGRFATPQQFLHPIQEPPKRRRGWVVALVCVAVLFVGGTTWLVIETSSDPVAPAVTSADTDRATRVVEAGDGLSRVTIPAQWVELPDSYRAEDAVLGVGQYFQERYLMLITTDPDTHDDFAAYEDVAVEEMTYISGSAVVSQPTPIRVGPLDGVRYEVTGNADGTEVIYWFTLLNGTRGYHQLITWTLPDRRATAEPALHHIVSTFEEVAI